MAPKIKVIEDSTFDLNGESCHRVVTEINGHDVQVIQYDESPNVVVFVDDNAKPMNISEVGQYVERKVSNVD